MSLDNHGALVLTDFLTSKRVPDGVPDLSEIVLTSYCDRLKLLSRESALNDIAGVEPVFLTQGFQGRFRELRN